MHRDVFHMKESLRVKKIVYRQHDSAKKKLILLKIPKMSFDQRICGT